MKRRTRARFTSVAVAAVLAGSAVASTTAAAAPVAAPPLAGAPCAPAPAVGLGDPEVTGLAGSRGISVAEAAERLRAQHRGAELAARSRAALGVDFGGFWYQPAYADRSAIGVVGGKQAELARQVAAQCGLASRTDVVPVAYSFAQLKQALAELSGDIGRVNAGAPASLGAALLTSGNAVELRVPADEKTLSAGQRALVTAAASRYGTMLRVRRTDASPRATACSVAVGACDAPLRGGVALFYAQRQDAALCTLGFLARSRSDRKLYAVTAGHCLYDPFVNVDLRGTTIWSRQPATGQFHAIGRWHNSYFDHRGDAGIITVDNPGPRGWAARAWVWVRPPEPTIEDYRISADGGQDDIDGKRLCHTGLRGGTLCGTVTGTYVTVRYADASGRPYPFTFTSLMESDACSYSGDSGGPHFSLHVAYGVQSGSSSGPSGCRSYIQSITQAENNLNVDVSHEG